MSMRIGVLASGQGTNLQAIIDACGTRELSAEVALVISNNSGSYALERARRANIPARHVSTRTHPEAGALDLAIKGLLELYGVELVVLAGYMRKLECETLRAFVGRIINTHPSLLPDFGGKGMYGMRVHEAVIGAGRKESGISVHVVDEDYDTGLVLAQRRVEIVPGDNAETLSERMRPIENEFLVETLQRVATGALTLRSIR